MKKIVIILLAVTIMLCGCGSPSPSSNASIYDNAVIEDVVSGSGEKIGEYAYIKANSKDVNEDVLLDVYLNYFKDKNLNWLMIIYTDKGEKMGAYFNGTTISDNIGIDYDGQYIMGDTSEEILYMVSDGKLVKWE